MRTTVRKLGNSFSVRIPAAIMSAARLQLNQVVDVREEGGRIVIEPIRAPAYDLATLLAGITNENLHSAADMGPAVGQEIW